VLKVPLLVAIVLLKMKTMDATRENSVGGILLVKGVIILLPLPLLRAPPPLLVVQYVHQLVSLVVRLALILEIQEIADVLHKRIRQQSMFEPSGIGVVKVQHEHEMYKPYR